ncbi:hypothetical protein LAZ67_22001187 [Cordylochernes scorpioides]|uniref:Uncharacterized protein n=1 Tax=Cordylochernes scorpioides TaxID=51811 RepID=A0ABY6LRC1_9ARAC|nr:hypothetical protein LAZ67_22001187 [Cordylochernes scorpioides]
MPSGQIEQRVNLNPLGKTATEAYAMLKAVYRNECLSRTQVFILFKWFKEERETTEDDPRPGRPSTTDDNIEKIGKLIREVGSPRVGRIDKMGVCLEEVKRKTALGRDVMMKWDKIMKDEAISFKMKKRIVETLIFPVVTYGCESWTLRKEEIERFDTFERWTWRKLLKIPMD